MQTMAVAPAHQGKGLGATLLEELLAEAGRRRQSPVLLEVRADNEPAQRLYARYGFTRQGIRRGYYPGGVDAWVMTRPEPAQLGSTRAFGAGDRDVLRRDRDRDRPRRRAAGGRGRQLGR